MSAFEDFIKSDTPRHTVVLGPFKCQDCGEEVPAARQDTKTGELEWECQKCGTITKIRLEL